MSETRVELQLELPIQEQINNKRRTCLNNLSVWDTENIDDPIKENRNDTMAILKNSSSNSDFLSLNLDTQVKLDKFKIDFSLVFDKGRATIWRFEAQPTDDQEIIDTNTVFNNLQSAGVKANLIDRFRNGKIAIELEDFKDFRGKPLTISVQDNKVGFSLLNYDSESLKIVGACLGEEINDSQVSNSLSEVVLSSSEIKTVRKVKNILSNDKLTTRLDVSTQKALQLVDQRIPQELRSHIYKTYLYSAEKGLAKSLYKLLSFKDGDEKLIDMALSEYLNNEQNLQISRSVDFKELEAYRDSTNLKNTHSALVDVNEGESFFGHSQDSVWLRFSDAVAARCTFHTGDAEYNAMVEANLDDSTSFPDAKFTYFVKRQFLPDGYMEGRIRPSDVRDGQSDSGNGYSREIHQILKAVDLTDVLKIGVLNKETEHKVRDILPTSNIFITKVKEGTKYMS